MIPGRKFPESLEETVVLEGNVQNDGKLEEENQPLKGWKGKVFPARGVKRGISPRLRDYGPSNFEKMCSGRFAYSSIPASLLAHFFL